MTNPKTGDVYIKKASAANAYVKLFIQEPATPDKGRWVWLKSGVGKDYPELSRHDIDDNYHYVCNISELFIALENKILEMAEET